MGNKRLLWGMMALALAFAMAVVGCGGDSGDGGPQWETPTGIFAEPFIGILSNGDTKMDITDWWGDEWTLTKSGGTLDGVWSGDDLRMTISGSNWTLAINEEGEKPGEKVPDGGGGGGDSDRSLSRASGNYFDIAKGTLTRSGSTVTFIATQVRMGEGGEGDVEDPKVPLDP
jgi:hypothetical protein